MANPTNTILLWLPLLLLLPLIFLMKMKKTQVKSQSKKLPPGPPKLPIIGNLHQLGPLAHQSLWELSKKYGPVMFLQLGGVPTIIISSSEAAMEVLKIHDLDCCSRPRLASTGKLSYNYLDIAFSPYSEYWREMRKLCVLELFSTKRVQSFRLIREEETAFLINSISQLCYSGSSDVDLSEKFISHNVNIVCRVAFGKIFSGSERFQELVEEAMAMLGCRAASDFFPSVGWIVDRVSGLHGRLERSFREMDAFYQKVIDDHLDPGSMKQEEEDEDIIDVLLRIVEKEEAGFGAVQITIDHIKAILMNIFLAGVDTGAIIMVWAMAELVRNPRVMQKAQYEIRSCIGKKGRVTESDLDRLHFFKMVVKETLRLHPPGVLLIPRETMSYFKLNGYDIYPKTRVQVNVWGISRDPNIWEEPEEFFPERFIDNHIGFKGQHFELLPFGSGRRGCPGILMGTSIVELTLANLLYCFDWKLPNGMKDEDINMDEVGNQTVHKKFPLHLVPIIHA